MNSSPTKGRNINITGINAQCMAQITDADNPMRSSFSAKLCFNLLTIKFKNQ